MLIIQDISASMDESIGSTTKWDAAYAAVTTVTNKYGLSTSTTKIRFGLELFATPDQSDYPPDIWCDLFGIGCPDDCLANNISVGVADNNAGPVQNKMGSVSPWSNTPMRAALDTANGYTGLRATDRQNFVLLITDGMETCDSNANSPIQSVTNLRNNNIKTYVVGFGSGVDAAVLNAMATAGGTAKAGTTKYYQCDNQADLTAALDAIAAQVATGDCSIPGKLGECAKGYKQCVNGQISCGALQPNPLPETCDGKDNDCDGAIDNGNPGGGASCNTGKPGRCAAGTLTCQGGALVCVQTAFPIAETCNGIDDDCNGTVDNGDPGGGASCNTGNPGICAAGVNHCQGGSVKCVQTNQPVAEICDGLDNNCDGTADNGDPGGGAACSTGNFGICAAGVNHCQNGSVKCVQTFQPSAEICNGLDDNCDGTADNGDPGGGASCNTGNPGICAAGVNHCQNGSIKCVQTNQPVAEICDGLDNNCDGTADNGDPGGGASCNTGNPGICAAGVNHCQNGSIKCVQTNQPVAEICDGLDNNCDGTADNGDPGGGASCNTGNPGICAAGVNHCQNGSIKCVQTNQPVAEICDGLDNNCDGTPDNGDPGGGGVCSTGKPGVCSAGVNHCQGGSIKCVQNIQPSAETCDGLDNDCDGTADNGDPGGGVACSTGKPGVCAAGVTHCLGAVVTCVQTTQPTAEICDGLDNNCDGTADNGDPGGGAACNTGNPGICAAGVNHCQGGTVKCVQTNQPTAEVCNGLDDDCNGTADNDDPGGGAACDTGNPGVCAAGVNHCQGGSVKCVQTTQPSAEICDGLDNDCNGNADNGDPGGGGNCNTGKKGECAAGIKHCVMGNLKCVQLHLPTAELCDGLDNDCDGNVDNGDPGSGGSCNTGKPGVCAAGVNHCLNGGISCVQSTQPYAEICDGLDNDCDGAADNGDPGGGIACNTGNLGICAAGITHCLSGQVQCVQTLQPVAEKCNDLDDDCNGEVDNGDPESGADCDTGNPGICAAGIEHCQKGKLACVQTNQSTAEMCNGLDDDCNGTADNGDPGGSMTCATGLPGICSVGTTHCINSNIACIQNIPATAELCNNMDDDCDGNVDNGDPGGGGSCSTGKPGICSAGVNHCINGGVLCVQTKPASEELCDGLDNDCDGTPDNGDPGGGFACSTGKPGVCSEGVTHCQGGKVACVQKYQATAEICDGLDNDCDGAPDNGDPGSGGACDTGNQGVCAAGIEHCQGGKLACVQTVQASGEACDGLDNDCDGAADNGDPGSGGACDTGLKGVCAAGVKHCQQGRIECVQSDPPSAEICDGQDNDCDGTVDNGNPGGSLACTAAGENGECANGTSECSGGQIICVPGEPSEELCDGLDNNCSGTADEGLTRKCENKCGKGTEGCKDGQWSVCEITEPTVEECNGLDDDCDNEVDNGDPGGGIVCSSGIPGVCSAGTTHCVKGAIECVQDQTSRTEECNGLDDDCDGTADNGDPGGGMLCDTGKPGECAAGTTHCIEGKVECVGRKESAVELCDGVDNDCDGTVDNGVRNVCGCCGEVPVEVCDGVDNDCDGFVDNKVTCPKAGQACVNGECVSLCVNNECPQGYVCRESNGAAYCVSPCNAVQCDYPRICDPLSGECFDPCGGVSCSSDQRCVEGQCVAKDCHLSGCPSKFVCVNGNCVADQCTGVKCDPGKQCVNGKCEPSCAMVSCQLWQRCVDGKCENDPCGTVSCPDGKKCAGGECADDPCLDITCGKGFVCSGGQCVDDPCLQVKCPDCQVCRDGKCYYVETPNDGGTTTDGGTATDGGNTTDGAVNNDGAVPGDGGVVTDGGKPGDDGGVVTDGGKPGDDSGTGTDGAVPGEDGGHREGDGSSTGGGGDQAAGCSCSAVGVDGSAVSAAWALSALLAGVALLWRRRV
jgi:hypothetical protein